MSKEVTDIFDNSVNQDKVKANDFCSKHVKFEMLIEEIEAKLPEEFGERSGFMAAAAMARGFSMECWGNPLLLIFEKGTANPYRRTILEKAKIQIKGFHYSESVLEDPKKKIEATKKFIESTKEIAEYFKLGDAGNPSLKFIFWALFAMAVDKSDYDEKAAVVADFAYMLKVDEKILQDVIGMIKVLCGEEKSNFEFKTDEVRDVFDELGYLL